MGTGRTVLAKGQISLLSHLDDSVFSLWGQVGKKRKRKGIFYQSSWCLKAKQTLENCAMRPATISLHYVCPNRAFSSTEPTSLHTFASTSHTKHWSRTALFSRAECSERQRHTLWLQAGGGRAVRSCTDRCVSLSSEHVHCHGNRGHSLCRSSEIYLVPMLWVTNPVEAEQGMENITSLPFHEFKGSTSFYLSSADSWAGF